MNRDDRDFLRQIHFFYVLDWLFQRITPAFIVVAIIAAIAYIFR